MSRPPAPRLAVLDYRMSNLRSVTKAFERLGARVHVARTPGEVGEVEAVVLPGVGHFGEATRRLAEQGLDDAVRRAAAAGVPVLGICLGMQLLFESSDEAPDARGLGLLAGAVRALPTRRKVPHIGWATVAWADHAWLAPEGDEHGESTYYFVHSYAAEPEDPDVVLGRVDYGASLCAVAGRPGLVGVQFHPEKSSAAGLGLLGRWLAGVGAPAGAA